MPRFDTLVLSMGPYKFATRTRKASRSYLGIGSVGFLSLAGVGRTGKFDRPGRWVVDGVSVKQVPVRTPNLSPSTRTALTNLILGYLPGFVRMGRAVMRTRAERVHVTGVPLFPLALLHHFAFRSQIVVDVNERPASVAASGSLFGLVSRLEPALLRLMARRASLTMAVAQGHKAILENTYRFTNVLVVRNSPLANWRATYVEAPISAPLRVVTVGTLFEGRGFEMLLEALSLTQSQGAELAVEIYGGGRPNYEASLRRLALELAVEDAVTFHGRIDGAEVSAAYLSGHIGLALYEAGDAGNDSLSNKMLECVSSGRPVLAGDLPENRRFIESYDVGWLTEVSATAIAASLTRIACEGTMPALTHRCRALGDAELTWEAEFGPVLDRCNGPGD